MLSKNWKVSLHVRLHLHSMLTSSFHQAIGQEVKTLNTNINSQFNDLRTVPYRLHSVFIHRGYVNSGHYWIYIYDFARELWRNYNDGYVTEVKNPREIFERDSETRPPTPYFLVYIKDEIRGSLVDSVCRDIKEPPEDLDAEMLDVGESHSYNNSYDLIDLSEAGATNFNLVSEPTDKSRNTNWDSSATWGQTW